MVAKYIIFRWIQNETYQNISVLGKDQNTWKALDPSLQVIGVHRPSLPHSHLRDMESLWNCRYHRLVQSILYISRSIYEPHRDLQFFRCPGFCRANNDKYTCKEFIVFMQHHSSRTAEPGRNPSFHCPTLICDNPSIIYQALFQMLENRNPPSSILLFRPLSEDLTVPSQKCNPTNFLERDL